MITHIFGYEIKHKFLLLLIALLLFFIINPFLVGSPIGRYLFGALFTIVLFFGSLILSRRRWSMVLGLVLAISLMLGLWSINFLKVPDTFMLIEYALSIIFFLMITVMVLLSVIADKRVTFNTLCGAISGYLLIGLLWSFIYATAYHVQAEAFNFTHMIEKSFDSHIQRFIYYSFVTLSTLGYGDVVPISNVAKTFAWLEAVVGQIYLTVWIAQLVGLHIVHIRSKKEETS